MLKIKDLSVAVDDKVILNNFSLDINDGEIVALMGPNGIGKSTICKVIMGDPNYKVLKGRVTYDGEDLLKMPIEERSRKGIYLVSQTPTEIEGVTNAEMLRVSLECRTGVHTNFFEFNRKVSAICKKLNIPDSFIHRSINVGMSGGEKKKNELLQLYVLEPKFIILDELDSGLDVDSLKELALSLVDYMDSSKSILIITHHTSILKYIKPNSVHILKQGSIVASGDFTLAEEIEKNGFRTYEVGENKTYE
ncbi:MAG: Fe-S cluster assembly ATPase SufC [Bacilli bacterium]|nr:Fe-S cluster assembly ATPase SufC [Bacilli bacterium]